MSTKILKSGKISFRLDPEHLNVIKLALKCRLYFEKDRMPVYQFFLLNEALEKLEKPTGSGKVSLRKSAFFAVFSEGTISHLDAPTAILIKDELLTRSLSSHPPEEEEEIIEHIIKSLSNGSNNYE